MVLKSLEVQLLLLFGFMLELGGWMFWRGCRHPRNSIGNHENTTLQESVTRALAIRCLRMNGLDSFTTENLRMD